MPTFTALLYPCTCIAPDNAMRSPSTGSLPFVQTKIKCWLFFSYVVAFAAVAGGVAVLVACVNKHHNLAIGIVRSFSSGRTCADAACCSDGGVPETCPVPNHWCLLCAGRFGPVRTHFASLVAVLGVQESRRVLWLHCLLKHHLAAEIVKAASVLRAAEGASIVIDGPSCGCPLPRAGPCRLAASGRLRRPALRCRGSRQHGQLPGCPSQHPAGRTNSHVSMPAEARDRSWHGMHHRAC